MDGRTASGGLAAVIVTGLVGLTGTGCATSGRVFVAQSAPYLVDVPVPQGYRLADRRSRDVLAGPSRVVQHTYDGQGSPLELRNFYHEQMPQGGWRPGMIQNENGTYTLRFVKEAEGCTIRISPRWWGLGGTRVQVSIWPRSVGEEMTASEWPMYGTE